MTLSKNEVREKVRKAATLGRSKTEIFDRLRGDALSDRQLAYEVAAAPVPALCATHRGKVKVLVGIMLAQSLIGVLMIIGASAPNGGGTTSLVGGGIVIAISLLFAWGFHRNKVGAYNGYLLLSFLSISNTVKGLALHPAETGIGLALGIALISFMLYVRQKLFPDFVVLGPKKVSGSFVFTT